MPPAVLALASFAAGASVAAMAVALRARRDERRRSGLANEQLRDLATRLEAVEQESARAASEAQVAQGILLDKGIADEEEIEAAHHRYDEASGAGYLPDRDGSLN